MQPVILVTADRRSGSGLRKGPRVRPVRDEAFVLEAYLEAIRNAGGLPLVVPPGPTSVEALLRVAHGVVLTGGDMDIHPSLYGEPVRGRLDRVEPSRTELEIELARSCLDLGVPVLGICGGMQVLAVAAGGTLIQDLPVRTTPEGIAHEQPADPATASHPVAVTDSLRTGLDAESMVNSTHHQAVKDPGDFIVVGRAPDGVIEVIAHPTHRFAVGVQWHPELLGQLGPYRRLVQAAQPER